MTFLITFVCTAVACFALREPLRRWPVAFYALAALLDVLLLAGSAFGLPRPVSLAVLCMLQKCYLPLSLFAVVMLIGVLPEGSRAKSWLKPVRAELSIVAWLLALGHMVHYMASYFPHVLTGGGVHVNVVASLLIAVVLFCLLAALGVTSFAVVKRKMSAELWRRIQRLSYLFFALAYVHLMIMLMPAALGGAASAQVNLAVYTGLFATYAVLRIAKAAKDRPKAS